MTPEERELLARLFEAYSLTQDPDYPGPQFEHWKATFEVAERAGIVDVSRLLPGRHGWDRT